MTLEIDTIIPAHDSPSTPTVVQVHSPGDIHLVTELFYPAPVINSPTPVPTIPYNTTSSLVVTGSGFDPNGSFFFFGTQPISATLQSTTQATVSIPYPFTTTLGVNHLKVTNPSSTHTPLAPGGGSCTVSVNVAYAAPVLASLSPTSTAHGSGQTSVTISGSGFIPGCTASWDGTTSLSLSFMGSNQVMVTLPASLLVSAGSHTISVSNPSPNMGASNSLSFTVS